MRTHGKPGAAGFVVGSAVVAAADTAVAVVGTAGIAAEDSPGEDSLEGGSLEGDSPDEAEHSPEGGSLPVAGSIRHFPDRDRSLGIRTLL